MAGLNREQLEYIKAFIGKRGFAERDLQYEILDHMTVRVGEKLDSNPGLDFEQAVHAAHQDFGALGFSTIEDAMRNSLSAQYLGQVRQELRQWFGFPGLLAVAGLGAALFFAYRHLPVLPLLIGVGSIYLLAVIGLFIVHRRAFREYRNTLTGKVALTFTLLIPGFLLQIWNYLSPHSPQASGGEQHPLFAVGFALLALIYAFAFAAALRVTRYALARCKAFEQQYGAMVGTKRDSRP